MENKKGSGIFLGVVGVATLIVAIIGATFAYFTATANSNENAVDLTAYEFNASLSVNPITTAATGLIPLAAAGNSGDAQYDKNLAYALNKATDKCKDGGNYQVCMLYEVTITNNATTAISLNGSLITTVNTAATEGIEKEAFTGLKAQLVTKEAEVYSLVDDSIVTLKDTAGQGTEQEPNDPSVAFTSNVNVDGKSGDVAGTKTLYFVVWLEENGDQSAMMGAHYEGQVSFAATTGEHLTGKFNVA